LFICCRWIACFCSWCHNNSLFCFLLSSFFHLLLLGVKLFIFLWTRTTLLAWVTCIPAYTSHLYSTQSINRCKAPPPPHTHTRTKDAHACISLFTVLHIAHPLHPSIRPSVKQQQNSNLVELWAWKRDNNNSIKKPMQKPRSNGK
jgi:hypothetical protein